MKYETVLTVTALQFVTIRSNNKHSNIVSKIINNRSKSQ